MSYPLGWYVTVLIHNQQRIEFLSDWTKKLSRGDFISRKLLCYQQNVDFDYLIHVTQVVNENAENSDSKTDLCGTPENTAKGDERGPQ
jgi:hypothetical protein